MVDLSFLEKFTKGDKKKMNRYIKMYLDTAPDTFNKMDESITAQNWEQLRINAHSLKPQADFMGIEPLKNTLIDIENAVKDGNTMALNPLLQQAFKLHEEASVFLAEHLND